MTDGRDKLDLARFVAFSNHPFEAFIKENRLLNLLGAFIKLPNLITI